MPTTSLPGAVELPEHDPDSLDLDALPVVDDQTDLIARAKALGVQVHRCNCDVCWRTSRLCTASLGDLRADVERAEDDAAARAPRFRVRYYDARLSRKGRGVQVAIFTDRAEAEAFAARNRIYARPCKVEES